MPSTDPYVAADASDSPKEECGVVGVYLPNGTDSDAARVAFFGIFALQHRGQESAGIAAGDGRALRHFTNVGLVSNAFRQEDLDRLPGHVAIGHTRYSTQGSSSALNAQPFISQGPNVELALGHNGNVINAVELRDRLAEWGVTCTTGSDSEVITHLLAWAPGDTWEEKTAYMMRSLQGAYSLVVATKDTLLGIRDPHGVRPLALGRYAPGGWIIASESCALDHVGAQFVREIEPGETVIIDRDGLRSIPSPVPDATVAHCVFEHIYFARP
ncbi:MAG: amidophosphoribosyltransferase, partial [Chloroflexi bacterium]|nr:amidophosphoribosyltransferase [Chloroflexota bacterium]